MKRTVCIQLQFIKFLFFVVTLIGTTPHICAQKFDPNFNIPGQTIVYDMTSNSKFVFAATGGSGLFRSPDEGGSWQDISEGTGDGYYCSLLSAHDSLYAGGFGSVFFSSDNGSNWEDLNLGFALEDEVLALAKSSQSLFAGVKHKGVIMRGITSGAWQAKNSGLHTSATVNDLLLIGSALYAATDKGLYVSANSGTSWAQVNSGISATVSVNKLYRKGSTVIAGTSIGFYKSIDNGNSWTFSGDGGAPVTPNIVSLTSLGNVYFGGAVSSTLHGLFLSFDQGNTWTTYTANAAAAMPYYSLTSTQNFVFAGIMNSILRYTPAPVGIEERSDDKPFTLYPNPCQDQISFHFPERTGSQLIEIYDGQGRLVLVAEQSDNIDISSLPAGIFFAMIKHPGGTSARRFIKE